MALGNKAIPLLSYGFVSLGFGNYGKMFFISLNLREAFILAFLAGALLFLPAVVPAQTAHLAAGELTVLRQTIVNGEPAAAGLMIGNQTQIKTAAEGFAALHFGSLGHLELSANTDFTVSLLLQNLGGHLQSGQAIVAAPANVIITVHLPNCRLINEGKTASAISVEASVERTVIRSYQGEFKVFAGDKIYIIASDEKLWLNQEGQSQPMVAGQMPTGSKQWISSDSQTTGPAMSLTDLIYSSIYYSFHRLLDSFRSASFLFETTVTCRDKDSLRCHPNGGMTP